MEQKRRAESCAGGAVITIRSWFGFFEAIALRREMPGELLACVLGMSQCRGRYGFGAEVGRG